MKAPKHTPTPWVRGEPDMADGLATILTADGESVIAEVFYAEGTGTLEQAEGDLAHMLAAPDLADALAEYVAEVDRDGFPSREWSDANLAKMRAALRKAGR